MVLLFRKDVDSAEEFEIARQYFDVIEYRTDCPDGVLVIGRYSVLPYYRELEVDLRKMGGILVNSYRQHSWIANFEYYDVLKEFTPESWDDYDFPHCRYPGPFVVKGRTNSRKHEWNTKMFAPTKRDALLISGELMKDGLIGPQGVIYRRHVPLKVFETVINGLPFSNEWRFFFYKEELLSYGYYWSSAEDVNRVLEPEGVAFAKEVAKIAAKHVNFFVLDIAEKEDGGWILIEVNDGQMSGLSENDPHVLYRNLKNLV
jgi:hypothetical protein